MKKVIENLLELQKFHFDEASGATVERRMAELRAGVPPQVIAHFDRLLEHGKKGVAVIRGQVCGECHMQVPRNTVLILMRDLDIQICENCGRYLYLAETAATPAEPVVEKKPVKKPVKRKRKAKAAPEE